MWIVDPLHDLVLIVGAPAIILPALWIAQTRFRPDQIYLFVASFGAIGHHLPGMMRAYGDRLLFQRFRYRFLLTPLMLVGICVLFAVRELNALVLIAYVWGVWHGLMQTYGFMRIYDAKVGAVSKATARLDSMMCIAWFVGAVLVSPTRMAKVLTDYYQSGGIVLPPTLVRTAITAWLAATAVITLAYLVHFARDRFRGRMQSPAKLLLLATSIGFWWYSNVAVSNMLVGIALFEIFHDVQYLTIVWIFNLARVDRNPGVGRFTRFLFRRSWSLAGLYVGLVAAYGSINLLPAVLSSTMTTRILTGLLTASALLHFYYDGFIWKVRDPSIRESLGVGAAGNAVHKGKPAEPIPRVAPLPWVHGLKWAAFIVPVVWLGVSQSQGAMRRIERDRLVVDAVPRSAQARNNLGGSLLVQGQIDEAMEHLREALRLDPGHAEAHSNLGVALARRGRAADAIEEYRKALSLDPGQTQAYSNLGNALLAQGRVRDAITQFDAALAINPNDPQARTNRAGALLRDGRTDAAIADLEEVLRVSPNFEPARRNLEIIRRTGRD
jgi:Flp pilus assembly protein TadD